MEFTVVVPGCGLSVVGCRLVSFSNGGFLKRRDKLTQNYALEVSGSVMRLWGYKVVRKFHTVMRL